MSPETQIFDLCPQSTYASIFWDVHAEVTQPNGHPGEPKIVVKKVVDQSTEKELPLTEDLVRLVTIQILSALRRQNACQSIDPEEEI